MGGNNGAFATANYYPVGLEQHYAKDIAFIVDIYDSNPELHILDNRNGFRIIKSTPGVLYFEYYLYRKKCYGIFINNRLLIEFVRWMTSEEDVYNICLNYDINRAITLCESK